MAGDGSETGWRRLAVSLAAASLLVAALAFAFGPPGAAAGVVLGLLGLAWRHDNQSGACFPLTLLFLLAIGILLLLFALAVGMGAR